MSSWTSASRNYFGQLSSAPPRRRSLDSSISSSSRNAANGEVASAAPRDAPSSSASSSSSASRKSSISSSSSETPSSSADHHTDASSTKAAAWVWHQRGVGEPVSSTKRVQRPGSSSSETPSPSHLPKSRFHSEPIKSAASATPPATPLFDAFELSSLKHQMGHVAERIQRQAPILEDKEDITEQMQEEEAAVAQVGGLPCHSSNLHVIKPAMEADLQSTDCINPVRRLTRVRHKSLDSDIFQDLDDAGEVRGGRPGMSSYRTKRSHSTSWAKPFSAMQKLFQKISKAVKGTTPKVKIDEEIITTGQEGLAHHHYHIYHHHHHHYTHQLEDGDFASSDEAYAMVRPRRRRFSDSAGAEGEENHHHRQQQAARPMATSTLAGGSDRLAPPAFPSLSAGSESGAAGPEKWWELYDQADRKAPYGAPREYINGASSQSSHGVNEDSSRLRERRLSKQSLQGNYQAKDAAEMKIAASAARLRRLSDSLSDREAKLREFECKHGRSRRIRHSEPCLKHTEQSAP